MAGNGVEALSCQRGYACASAIGNLLCGAKHLVLPVSREIALRKHHDRLCLADVLRKREELFMDACRDYAHTNVISKLRIAASMTVGKTTYADGTSKTEVVEHSFEPVVCHFDGGTTCEYFLVDYPDEMASYNGGGAYSTDMIWGMWTGITGLGRDTSATGC